MEKLHLTEAEEKLARLLWAAGPLPSAELVRRCQQTLGWKKSTTYTILHRLAEKGVFCNRDGTVQAQMTAADYESAQAAQLVDTAFGGSLPRFLTAFSRGRRLSEAQVRQLQELIAHYEEE